MVVVRSALKRKILQFFFLNEKARVYVNQLARQIASDPKNVHRALLRLEAEGVLKSEFQGNQRYFFCNVKGPFYAAYRELFLGSSGVEAVVRQALEGLPGLEEAHIFGSYAAGGLTAESDVDVLLLGTHKALAAERALKKVSRELGRDINAVHLTPQALKAKQAKGETFIRSVFENRTIKVL